MTKLTITAKGQVTLRKELLQHLGVEPGQKVSVEKLPNGRVEVSAARAGRISEVFGMIGNPEEIHLSIEEMAEIACDAWAGKR